MGEWVSGAAADADVGEGVDVGLVSGCGDGGVATVGIWWVRLWHGFGGLRAAVVGRWLGWEKQRLAGWVVRSWQYFWQVGLP